jgi:DNA-3-methyladenine glycosylase I
MPHSEDLSPKGRCGWSSIDDPAMQRYHDTEWGVPVHDDRRHFEFLALEGAQAGLSWSTILHKRDGYRRAFSSFDPGRISRYSAATVQRLRADPGIVRNRLKIESVVSKQCPGVSPATAGVRELRQVCLEVRRRETSPESLAEHPGPARHVCRVRRV